MFCNRFRAPLPSVSRGGRALVSQIGSLSFALRQLWLSCPCFGGTWAANFSCIDTVERIADTFGGINLKDIKAPECFEIEQVLIEQYDIPVFHDDSMALQS